MIPQGIAAVVAERRQRVGAFRLRKASFKGDSLQPGVEEFET